MCWRSDRWRLRPRAHKPMAPLRRRTYDQDVIGTSDGGTGRSTAIVLFTDLVGSTELRSRLGEEAAEELRREHDRLLADAIEKNRGRLVKNLGDGVMATFTGALDAVTAGVNIQQAVDRRNRAPAGAVPLEVRIGLSAGDVAFDEADCFGTPVIEAARLCAAAAGGQILVTEVVRLLAGSGGGQQFASVGTLNLKGLPAPVPACEVEWEPLLTAEVPMPALLTDKGRIFVSREAEVERLAQLWKEGATAGQRVALLAGEPGVGKTRLAAEVAEAAHAEGATVLAGRCDEDLGVPYQPFVEALRHFVDHTSPEDLPGLLGRYGGELVRLVPELAERVPGLAPPLRSDPETERYRLFDAVAAWLAATSGEQPVVLVLDDLQWAAKPTLLLLRHVVRSAEPKRLLVLGTYRDTDLGHDHPLVEVLADLRRQGGVERLSLTGFDSSGVAAFMTQAAGHELDDEDLALALAIHEETEGNPFFVREVLRHLAETGALEQQEGRWGVRLPLDEFGIPEGVREVVGRRLARLSKATNRVLRGAAVLGAEFELSVLLATEGTVDEEDLLVAVEEATAARLIIEAPGPTARYRFAHALVRDTIYRELSAARRVTLHRQMAQAIEAVHAERLDDYLPALAHHWARAAAPAADTAKAVDYATRAGDRALAQLAHDEAAAYYRSALDLLGTSSDAGHESQRLELLISLGDAQRRAGDPAHRQTLLDAARLARQRGDADGLARAALANHRGLFASVSGTVDSERIESLEAALDMAGSNETPIRARLLAALAQELLWGGDRRQRIRLSDEALAIARRVGDPNTLAHVLLERFLTISPTATVAESLSDTAELLMLAQAAGDPLVESRANYLRYRAATVAGDLMEADRCLDAAEALSSELGQPTLSWQVSLQNAVRLLMAGEIEGAERLVQTSFELGQAAGQLDAHVYFVGQLFTVRFEQGRLEEIEHDLTVAVEALPGLPLMRACLALLYCELDLPAQARAHFEKLACPEFTSIPVDAAWPTAMACCAMTCRQLEDVRRAEELHRLLTPYSDQVVLGGIGVYGSFTHHLATLSAVLSRFDQAGAEFESAARLHERLAAPTWLARTRLEWARMLLTRAQPGDAERAREFLGQALATARELGLANVERRAVQLLKEQW